MSFLFLKLLINKEHNNNNNNNNELNFVYKMIDIKSQLADLILAASKPYSPHPTSGGAVITNEYNQMEPTIVRAVGRDKEP